MTNQTRMMTTARYGATPKFAAMARYESECAAEARRLEWPAIAAEADDLAAYWRGMQAAEEAGGMQSRADLLNMLGRLVRVAASYEALGMRADAAEANSAAERLAREIATVAS